MSCQMGYAGKTVFGSHCETSVIRNSNMQQPGASLLSFTNVTS